MNCSARSSSDEISITSSAVRRINSTPTENRLTFRRLGTASVSSGSVKSFEIDKQPSCVTRETSGDEGGLHRFIVWVAVKRNACAKMTAEERRECPMLRCRKRFDSHELMLQHLYACEELEAGEYWCYECGRVEKLPEIRCRRCPGHPSMRKRLMSKAKSVFSSLGRAKLASSTEFYNEVDGSPSAYCSMSETSRHLELQSNEIHEIGSSKDVPPTIAGVAQVSCEAGLYQLSSSSNHKSSSMYADVRHSGVATSMPLEGDSLVNWGSLPELSTISPAQLETPRREFSTGKPALQVNTTELDCYRSGPESMSKDLEQSNSLRSVTSATSTKSTFTNTTSCNVSPLSTWSDAWGNSQYLHSTLTSPADDIPSVTDTFPYAQSFPADFQGKDGGMHFEAFLDSASGSFALPAEMPTNSDAVDFENLADLPAALAEHCSSELDDVFRDVNSTSPRLKWRSYESHYSQTQSQSQRQTSVHTLVRSAQDTLELHLKESRRKMDEAFREGECSLVTQLFTMPLSTVAAEGLDVMLNILRGEHIASPLQLLCYIHVVYSLSLVVHGQIESKWWSELFLQCLSFGSWLSDEERQAYLEIVELLWKPAEMEDETTLDLLLKHKYSPLARSSVARDNFVTCEAKHDDDLLVFISECFLDELELVALREDARPHVQASALCLQHLKDPSFVTLQSSSFFTAAECLVRSLCQQYCGAGSFVRSLNGLLQNVEANQIRTLRRLELELMHLGKMQMPTQLDLKCYIEKVRRQINKLQERNDVNCLPRLSYQELGIRLVAKMMQAPNESGSSNEDFGLKSLRSGSGPWRQEERNAASLGSKLWADLKFPTSLGDGNPATTVPFVDSLRSSNKQKSPDASSPNMTEMHSSSSPLGRSGESIASHETDKMEADMRCKICGYKPKGDPKWFHGSMAKHRKLQHGPPKMYPCPFPGCNSQYKNRPDNLRQHQIEKGHFLDNQGGPPKRQKRRKMA